MLRTKRTSLHIFAGILLFFGGRADAVPVLFSVQESGAIAENLSYGPTAITTVSPPFLSTLVGSVLHTQWTSEGFDAGNNLVYSIDWQFSSAKTVAQRFQDAVTVGEAVNWTVTSPSNGVQTYAGTWYFSTGAGNMTTRFAGSGSNFSNDDGLWGAGTGILNGDGGTGPQGSAMAWGIGNFDFSDSNGTLWQDGVPSALPAGFRNYVYVEDSIAAVPEIDASSATIPLALMLCLFLTLSERRRKVSLAAH